MLDLAQFVGGELLEMREVKAQGVGRYERAFLLDVRAQDLAEGVVEQVGGRVVGGCGAACLDIYGGGELMPGVGGHFLGQVYGYAVLALGIVDLDDLAGDIVGEGAFVAYLSAHFGVEGRGLQDDLVELAVLLLDMAVAGDFGLGLVAVIAHEDCVLGVGEDDPVGGLDCGGVAGALFLGSHLDVKALVVEGHAVLLENELCEVEGESVCVIEGEGFLAADLGLAVLAGAVHGLVKEGHAFVEGAQEGVLLLLDDAHDEFPLSGDLGVGIAHGGYQGVDQPVHEGLLLAQEGIGVTDGAAQDAADDVSGLGVRGKL